VKIGVVSGLPRETDCLSAIPESERAFATFAGIGPERAEEGARALIDQGARALMSFGVAGGLSAEAAAGVVVLATTVVDGPRRIEASAEWRAAIQSRIGDAVAVIEAPVAGADRMVPTPEAKLALHEETRAAACDMESHAVARVAVENGIPFAVVRSISDPRGRVVPKWVLRCVTPAGDVRKGALAWQAVKRPWALANLVGLAGDSGKAFAGLRRVAGRLGPGLGLGAP